MQGERKTKQKLGFVFHAEPKPNLGKAKVSAWRAKSAVLADFRGSTADFYVSTANQHKFGIQPSYNNQKKRGTRNAPRLSHQNFLNTNRL